MAEQVTQTRKLKRAERQPMGGTALYGGIYIKEMLTPDAGTIIPTHSHGYDHISYLAAGAVRVWCDGEDLGEFRAPAAIRIPKNRKHRFETLVNWTLVLCCHSVADAENFDEDDLIHEEHQLEMEG